MRLTGRQEVDLIKGIAAHFNYEQLQLTLRKIEKNLLAISAKIGMLQVAQLVVDEAIRTMWMENLVDVLVKDRPGQQTFEDTKALLESTAHADETAGLACHEHYLLPGLLPFLDREKFRAIANHFNKPGRRILTIKGGDGTGKTYSKEFIFHMAQARKAEGADLFRPVWVDLTPSADAPTRQLTDGLMVITEIVNQINEVELPEKYENNFAEQKEQAATWAKNVGSWLTGALSNSNEIYWVIIDGVNEGPMAKSAELLIDDLIGRVGNNLTAIRLILLGYDDEDFDSRAVQRHEDETLDLTDPNRKDELYEELGKFLMQANAVAYATIEGQALVDRITDDANELLQEIDPATSGQMQVLANELARKAQSYEQGADG